ncbi:MAG: DUF481 domain-containing protein [Kangiellaceae bacterium]|nr:DUF481 domain-containing protein [Kangiellaceae bacterium]
MKLKHFFAAITLIAASSLTHANSLLSDAPEQGHVGTFDFGYVSTSGNSDTESLNGAFNYVVRVSENYSSGINATGINNQSGASRDAEKYTFAWNNRYDLNEKSFLYGILDYVDDRFGAYDYQAGAYFGYGHQFFKDDSGHFSLGIGAGYRINAAFIGEDEKETVLRGDLDYAYNISETAIFTQKLTAIFGEEVDTYTSETALATKISDNLALKLAYLVQHNSVVPAGAEKTDRTTTIGVSYSF